MSLQDICLAAYECNESAGANFTDSHSSGKTLTQVNSPGSDGAGARTFVQASIQYGGITDAGAYFSPATLYFAARVKPTSTTSGSLTGKRSGSAVEWVAEFVSDLFIFRMRDASTTSFSATLTAPPVDQWSVVEGCYDTTSNFICASVNGVDQPETGGGSIYSGTADFRLGAIVSGVAATYNGAIDAAYFFSAKPTDYQRFWLRNGTKFRTYAELANSPTSAPKMTGMKRSFQRGFSRGLR